MGNSFYLNIYSFNRNQAIVLVLAFLSSILGFKYQDAVFQLMEKVPFTFDLSLEYQNLVKEFYLNTQIEDVKTDFKKDT